MIYRLYEKIFSSKILRFIFMFLLVLGLTCCDKEDDNTKGGEEANFVAQSQCWQAKILSACLKVIDTLFQRSAGDVGQGGAGGGAAVICVGFSIWMAFKLIKVLPSMKEENLGEVWTEIGQKLFVCAFCAIIVSSVGNITWALQTFAIPIYNTILELGGRIMAATNPGSSSPVGEYGQVVYQADFSGCKNASISVPGLKSSILPMAKCLTCAISDRLNTGVKIGTALMGTGDIGAIFVGLIILLLFSLAKFGFVLFVVDSLFRLNFAIFLLPIMMCGIPFSYTRKWSKSALLMFLNSSGIMLFLGLLVCIGVGAIEYIMNGLNGSLTKDSIEGMGPVLLSLFLVAVLFVNIPGLGVALADKFIGGGGGMEFQKRVSKFVVKTVKAVAAAVMSAATSGATSAFTTAMDKYEVTRATMDKAKSIKDSVSSTINSLAGYNDDK